MRLILASSSPRRAELLRAAGYTFDIHPAEVDERIHPGESPATYVERVAAEKSAKALDTLRVGDGFIVLAADTAVVIGDEILGKPRDAEDAARMLRKLSGRTHEVMTGVSVRSASVDTAFVEVTSVTFVRLTEDQIAWYVASAEGTDKAGAYAIQGLASRFIPRIEGSYSNVVGLPIAAVDGLIQRLTRSPSVLASQG
jgi:septum formation protein